MVRSKTPRLVTIDAASIPPRLMAGVQILIDSLRGRPDPGLIILRSNPLASHPCTLLAAAMGAIEVDGSTDGRCYILRAAGDRRRA